MASVNNSRSEEGALTKPHWARMLAILGLALGVGLTTILGGTLPPALGQEANQELPVVASASVPFYPRTPLLAHIQGIVKIRVTTDGKKISSLEVESGPPMLAKAAEENIRSWQFEEHKPMKFLVTFEYAIEEPVGCTTNNETVVLHMPLDVHVSAKGVHACDPATEVPHANSK